MHPIQPQRYASSSPTRTPPGSTSSSALLGVVPLALVHPAHGSPLEYAGIALAAAVGWFGVPGPGEAVLIASAVLAAHHKLDIGVVIGAAAAGATAGGIAGWLAGIKVSRPLLRGRGPLWRTRRRLIARGERFFEHHGPIGVFLAPSWAAGIHGMPARRFVPLNIIAAIAWATIYGGVAFLIGPDLADVLGEGGALLPIAVAIVVLVLIGARRVRRWSKLLPKRKIRLRDG